MVSDAPLRVLVVDDDPDLLDLLRLRFEIAGFGVRQASNGAEAVEAVRNQGVAVAVLDLEMPVMTGQEAIPRMREIDPGVRIVVHTARHEFSDLLGDTRPDAIFRKGMPLGELVQTVEALGAESPGDEQLLILADLPLPEATAAFEAWVDGNARIRETLDLREPGAGGAAPSAGSATSDIAALTQVFIDLGMQLTTAAQNGDATIQLRLSVQRADAEAALRAIDRIDALGLREFYAGWGYTPAPEVVQPLCAMVDRLREALAGPE